MQFTYTISHVLGKMLYTADTFSHASVDSIDLTAPIGVDTENSVQAVVSNCLLISSSRLDEIHKAQNDDSTCYQLMNFCKDVWLNSQEISGHYYAVKAHLSVVDNLLLYANRTVVPHSM